MRSLAHLNKYLYKYRLRLLLGVLFIIVSNLFTIVPAQIIRYAIDYITETVRIYNIGEINKADIYKNFTTALILFASISVLMALLKGVFMFFMRQTIIIVSRLVEFDLKNEIYAHYQVLGLDFYRKNNTGDLMARISEDVGKVRMYVGPAIMYSINLTVLFFLVVSSMLNVSVRLTLFVLLPLMCLSFGIYYISNLINKRSEEVQSKLSDLSTFVQEAFSGIRVIKAFVREKDSLKNFSLESNSYKDKNMRLTTVNAMFSTLMLLLIGLSTLITIYIGGQEAIEGKITPGNIAEFIVYVNLLTWPMAAVGWVTSIIQRAAASQERINEFLHLKPSIVSTNPDKEEIKGKIEFKNVSFVYPDSGIEALKNISLKISPGKSLGIMGRTGSGKSTIANLILRMYDPTGGQILVDEKKLKEINLSSLRSQSGYVPQDVFLFSDTIANNITFGLDGSQDDIEPEVLIEQAAKDAHIYDNILAFPEKFETRVGERGLTLSGGQKQRISIARAIVKSPSILIFDDCLSAVDTKTEEHILSNLKRIMKGRTSIIISHRVSSVKDADHIIILEEGKIIEEGTHNSLMAAEGFYHSLFKKQQLEKETEND